MRWQGRRQSGNVVDRRGMPIGGRGLAFGGGGAGLLIIALIVFIMGGNPLALLQQAPSIQLPGGGQTAPTSPEEDQLAQFVGVVLADTEDVWNKLFEQRGQRYIEPKLVLFTGQTQSGCGYASSAVGPFYCPADQTVYVDLGFFAELRRRFGAPGDFAQAYVIAHEVGHHVQNLLGISEQVQARRTQLSEVEYNQLSVRLELQADFLAGVWAHHAERLKNILDPGDVEEALRAASAIGDDTLQKEAQGHVVPDAFTHGSSAQRVRWFRQGLDSGDLQTCDTFNTDRL
ncbi:MAG TPA: neutral zinc metallopeptidase [Methyloceanibacter sp.]|nr:neutral zinc metallopeptidase [Methyloceanibacter sp.]